MPDPERPRPFIRDALLAALLTIWIVALLRTEHAPPLTPPAVPYAGPSR